MLPRLAHNQLFYKVPAWLSAMLGFFLLSACTPSQKEDVDRLNDRAYAWHYRSLDSTEYYARQALALSVPPSSSFLDGPSYYADGYAEALNNLAFVAMVHMDYARADSLLQEIIATTDNQIELLVAEVQQMRLCQRRSQNRSFYEHREQAQTHLLRIAEERHQLPQRLQRRLAYAESEMAIVTSTYYYYVGLERQSVAALRQQNLDDIRPDTAQYLNYLYNVGAGGILTEGSPQQIHQEEVDYLYRCLNLAHRHHYPYFEAQAKEGLADHTEQLLSSEGTVGSVQLAEESLMLFQQYGDVYQIAGAYRTLASCYHAMGNDLQALEYLHLALADSVINQAPDLVASIREQLSVAYSALDNKVESDASRNIYIDLQEQTRQDRQLEARAGLLDAAVTQLNWMIFAVVVAILLLVLFLVLFSRRSRQERAASPLDDLLEQRQEEVAAARLRVEQSERRNLEQRAKVSLAISILPLIDRILYTVQHKPLDVAYVRELTDSINEQNDLLTQWIQLRQGELNLHIESFSLQSLFDMVARGKRSFAMKGVTLDVLPTTATVKADKVLTLFMLNTLADNARKFTPQEGSVTITATEAADYVEISVSDTGCGMDADQLAHVFNHKVQQGHGFGLMNCKGIIEKYRKMSHIFSVCQLQAESEKGRGSRFFFRLPKGIQHVLLLLLLCAAPYSLHAASPYDHLNKAHVYADSAFFCNINGRYEQTLAFADSCRQSLNAYYLQQQPGGRQLMVANGDDKSTIPEIQWFHQGLQTNYQIILDIRNESAVAALALHEWQLYAYNNKVYTQLFKELSADTSLADYCRTMQQSRQNKRIAVILLLVLLTSLLPAYFLLYYRHRLSLRFHRERQQQTDIELANDEWRRAELENANLHVANSVLDNCLSTLKHETMYYPSRIRQLVDAGELTSLGEVTGYYRDLYGILIQQALEQARGIHLHIKPLTFYGQQVLGDDNLLHELFELLVPRKTTDLPAVTAEVKDDNYIAYHITTQAALTPFDTLLCRQIVRDHGEATNRRACGITIADSEVTVVLPRYTDKTNTQRYNGKV